MGKLLKVDNLSIRTTSGKELIKNISFNVERNEIVALIGRSGCGKTMSLLAIMGLLPTGVMKSNGQITLSDKLFSPDMRGQIISMIMQAPASCFDGVFTIRAQFEDILKSNGKIKLCNDDYFYKIISEVGLPNAAEILSAYPSQLSGGMLQRLMIAITLALDSKIIIADEPTSDLDLPAQAEIIKMIAAIDKKDRGILLITHDIGVALGVADRIIVMDDGRIVDNFATKDAYVANRNVYTKSLLQANIGICSNPWGIDFGGAYA